MSLPPGDWYVAGLGFIDLFSFRAADGSPALVHRRRCKFQVILVRPAAQPPVPGTAATLSMTRDVITRDPDGNPVIFTAPGPTELTDAAFSASIRGLHEAERLTPVRYAAGKA